MYYFDYFISHNGVNETPKRRYFFNNKEKVIYYQEFLNNTKRLKDGKVEVAKGDNVDLELFVKVKTQKLPNGSYSGTTKIQDTSGGIKRFLKEKHRGSKTYYEALASEEDIFEFDDDLLKGKEADYVLKNDTGRL